MFLVLWCYMNVCFDTLRALKTSNDEEKQIALAHSLIHPHTHRPNFSLSPPSSEWNIFSFYMWQNAQFSFHLIRYCNFIACVIQRKIYVSIYERTKRKKNKQEYKYHKHSYKYVWMRWKFFIWSETFGSRCSPLHPIW